MSDEPQNTEQLRAQAAYLLSRARAQSFDIQRMLGSLHGGTGLQSRLAAASAQISDAANALSQALGSPDFALSAADLMALSGIVQSGETSALLSEAAVQVATATSGTPDLATASAKARSEVQSLSHEVFDQHLFDKYLHFSSAEDEDEFRKREAAAKAYVQDQLAKGTPEGDLNASGGMMGVMLDQHTHGAGDSPDFLPRWNTLVEKTEHLRAAVVASGKPTEEFDRNLTASVRRFLKAKGLSDAQIDARLTASPNPLDAAKSLLAYDQASQLLEQQTLAANHAERGSMTPVMRVEATTESAPANAALAFNPDAMAARLQAAGFHVPSADFDEQTGHGLAGRGREGRAGAILGGID